MNTVPTPPADADRCQLDWCTARRGHHGHHVRVIDVVEPTRFDNNVQAVIVTIEAGRGEIEPLPVVTLVGDGESFRRAVRLDWSEASALAGLLARAVESHDPDRLAQRRAPVDVRTHHEASEWEHALLRLGASGTLEHTGTAVVVEHDATDDTLRLHAPERTDLERVREVVRAAAVQLGIIT